MGLKPVNAHHQTVNWLGGGSLKPVSAPQFQPVGERNEMKLTCIGSSESTRKLTKAWIASRIQVDHLGIAILTFTPSNTFEVVTVLESMVWGTFPASFRTEAFWPSLDGSSGRKFVSFFSCFVFNAVLFRNPLWHRGSVVQ